MTNKVYNLTTSKEHAFCPWDLNPELQDERTVGADEFS